MTRPQGILQSFRQRREALTAEGNVGMLKTGEDEPEVIQQMLQRFAGNADAG